MRAALFPPLWTRQRVPLRERMTASAVAVLIEVLIALALLYALTPRRGTAVRDSDLKTFSAYPDANKEATARPSPKRASQQKHPDSGAAPPVVAPPVPIVRVKKPTDFALPGLIPMDLSKADISKIPSHGDEGSTSGDGEGNGKSNGSVYGPGEGPGGERLYDVAWYREPTHAELAGYLPNGAPPGSYALIACRMIADYHVENCRSLGESPVGSGLARAMRQAAWQFLVRPPRIGDKVMLGTWVRIRIEFNKVGD